VGGRSGGLLLQREEGEECEHGGVRLTGYGT
jgi:hypothetical protein